MERASLYQQYIALSKYARWDKKKGRRETWKETVTRYCDFLQDHMRTKFSHEIPYQSIFDSIYNLEVMPSMRALMTAGKAAKRDNAAIYNCGYLEIDCIEAFAETMYLEMCGVGVGYSVENRAVNKLPSIPKELHYTRKIIIVNDSKIGWCDSFKELLTDLYGGIIPQVDYSKIRKQGAILKTFGGRASGYFALRDLFNFVIDKFKHAKGRQFTDIEVFDIMNKCSEVIVMGGVRRVANCTLFDLASAAMREAKTGNWIEDHPYRRLSNISAVFEGPINSGEFLEHWNNICQSKSGEYGIFNRRAVQAKIPIPCENVGTNPCFEAFIIPPGFCNLTEVVITPKDNENTISHKAKLASMLATYQSTFTDFRYLRKEWKENCHKYRLIGVSLTGIYDNVITFGADHFFLSSLKQTVITENKRLASLLKINKALCSTCLKPSGTVSQLVNCSPGIHPRHSQYYIRHIRASNINPLTKFLIAKGVPNEKDTYDPENTIVFSFPIKSPDKAILRKDLDTISALEISKRFNKYYATHSISCTISIRKNEWMKAGAWVFENFEEVTGLAFLPFAQEDTNYVQMPFQECTKEEYEKLKASMPIVDWRELATYEQDDYTTASQELACKGNSCII